MAEYLLTNTVVVLFVQHLSLYPKYYLRVSVFRFSAAQVRWSKVELDQLQSLWVQAYKRADHLPRGTASDIFIFPEKRGGEELSTPINIIAQELCNNIRRSLVHDDVAKSITVMELQPRKSGCVTHYTSCTTRWSFGSGTAYSITDGRGP